MIYHSISVSYILLYNQPPPNLGICSNCFFAYNSVGQELRHVLMKISFPILMAEAAI
jgi:hypothetical protein